MALTAWPFADVDTTEAQYGSLFQLFQHDGIVGIPGDTAAAVNPVSGMTVRVSAFTLAYLGGVAVASSATVDLILGSASASTRVDRVVLRIGAANDVSIAVLPGTSGVSSPAAVTRVPGGIYELPLARVTVAAGVSTIVAGDIVDERSFVSTQIGRWTTATRPGTTGQRAAIRGDFGFNSTLSVWEGWNGSVWGSVAQTQTVADVVSSTAFIVGAGWSVVGQRFIKSGRVVSFNLNITRTGAQIEAATSGDFPDVVAGTINNPAFKPANPSVGAAVGKAGAQFGVSIDAATMTVYVTSASAGQPVNTGQQVAATFTYVTES